MDIKLPDNVRYIIDRLQEAGFEAYAVGGCIRDVLLSRKPNDWDITTSALPMEVKKLFDRTVDTGIKHGTVTVLWKKESYEVTTYRVDGEYEDGRHPKQVRFTASLEEDLKRRDFTVNAMAYNDRTGLVDLFGGMEDLNRGIIRCVGIARERFSEDALRILRAVRFAAQLGYGIDEETREAMRVLAPSLKLISAERIQAELVRLVTSPNPDRLREAYELGLTAVFLPEFDQCMGVPQNIVHHKYDVGEHILRSMCCVRSDRILRLTMLFHDIGKPVCRVTDAEGTDHFRGHQKVSADMSVRILRRLKFDNDTIKKVRCLVENHDVLRHSTLKSVRRMASSMGEELFPLLLEVKRADIEAQSEYRRAEKLAAVSEAELIFEQILEQKQCLSIKELEITGRDIIKLGISPGPEVGAVLEYLLDRVLDDSELNKKDRLTELALMKIKADENRD